VAHRLPFQSVGICLLLTGVVLALAPGVRAAAPLVVTSAADNGAGSLRQAILDANASPGADSITFAIPGAGVHTIALASDLPALTETVSIDGYSQPGASPNTLAETSNAVLTIELRGPRPIGLDITGTACVVRGLAIFDFQTAIRASSAGNVFVGNFVGLDASGAVRRNAFEGLRLNAGATGTLIGSTDPAGRNVITGNQGAGVLMAVGSSATVQGNLIGLLPGGTAPSPLDTNAIGIWLLGSAGTLIGGQSPGSRNVISGNTASGIRLDLGATGNTVQGNLIGTGVSGTSAVPNRPTGIDVGGGAHDNLIGGTQEGAGNLISGNGGNGISFLTSGTADNLVQGNFIGTDVTGGAALPNEAAGVGVALGAGPVIIGGPLPAARNLISGNALAGIDIDGPEGFPGTARIQGNSIGVGRFGLALGNGGPGIRIRSTGSTVGGLEPGEGNVIAANAGDGIECLTGAGTNTFRGNVIVANGGLGIDLNGGAEDTFGVTANDPGDGDFGPNRLQNFPVVSAVVKGYASTLVVGTSEGPGGQPLDLDFFANQAADPSGYGEGERLLGTTRVVTDGFGGASFMAQLPATAPNEVFITATVTDSFGNTSEFSRAAPAPSPTGGVLAVSRQRLTFLASRASPTQQLVLQLSNRGRGPLYLLLEEAELGEDFSFAEAGSALMLRPNERRDVRVQFAPQRRGTKHGLLLVHSNDPRRPTVLVKLLGKATGLGR